MRLLLTFSLLLLTGCFQGTNPIVLSITQQPAAAPTMTPGAEEWEIISPGLAQRTYRTEVGATIFQVVRIDPQLQQFRVHYRPGSPLTIDEWSDVLPAAQVIVNANFFTPEHTILGLLISDNAVYGQSYTDRGGTFFIQNGLAGIRSNIEQPYAGESWEQAVQAFPMLVSGGQQAYTNTRDLRPARRTVIGQDSSGRIILMTTPGFGIGLAELSAWLPTTDLQLVTALNLDGGGSTMMKIRPLEYTLRSFDPVPAVLAVYDR